MGEDIYVEVKAENLGDFLKMLGEYGIEKLATIERRPGEYAVIFEEHPTGLLIERLIRTSIVRPMYTWIQR